MTATKFMSATTLGSVVADLIRATKHDSTPRTRDAQLLCDIDLSILGSAPDEYAAYSRAIRDEYAWVPFPKYAEARIRVLETFLARPSVFMLDELQQKFGEQAVSNMGEEIRSLSKPPPDESPDTL